LYEEVVKYEHCDNDDVKHVLDAVVIELKQATKELREWKFVIAVNKKKGLIIENANATKHRTYADEPSTRLIDTIKGRWNVL
jgi:16S rRNA U516 pseudouridylate synthase RsuA-like enzyme